jgi:hypothetical protein
MNTYTWSIQALDCIPSIDGKINVVSVVHWRVNGTDGTHNATVYGAQSLTYTADSPFTTYYNLTKDTVIGWVQEAMGAEQVTAIQTNLDNQIKKLINPSIVFPSLPWVN